MLCRKFELILSRNSWVITGLDLLFIHFCWQIAAASLEKLFQHLTNPQHEDFIDVFLNTYASFTTPKDVLTALLNCIDDPKEKTPDPTCAIQVCDSTSSN